MAADCAPLRHVVAWQLHALVVAKQPFSSKSTLCCWQLSVFDDYVHEPMAALLDKA
jgi:hypothetical protein